MKGEVWFWGLLTVISIVNLILAIWDHNFGAITGWVAATCASLSLTLQLLMEEKR